MRSVDALVTIVGIQLQVPKQILPAESTVPHLAEGYGVYRAGDVQTYISAERLIVSESDVACHILSFKEAGHPQPSVRLLRGEHCQCQ
jgi:hypothetical protein